MFFQQLLQLQQELEKELLGQEQDQWEVKELEQKIEQLTQQRNTLAQELSQKRKESVASLSATLQDMIRDLQMPYAVFEVAVQENEKYTLQGKDNIEFLFSANGGNRLGLLHKSASGGELSRIMLCLKSLMAQYTGMPTMIFDEIDTGVSGSIADKMGALIGKMGERMQIFAITHLPQIASKKGTHLLVYKEFDADNNATTCIRTLGKEERVNEVARMLSGSELTKAAIENARELLNANDNK